MLISGKNYDLADGRLFLVSTRGDKPAVKQLTFDFDALQGQGDSLAELARSKPEIGEFFQEAHVANKTPAKENADGP